jgi:putative RNA 2'-phosphotransferase
MDEVQLSKFLSLVLRHKPETVGLCLDSGGWVSVDELLSACAAHGRTITRAQLEAVVAGSDKKRFAFSAGGNLIRASQGHSLQIDLGYEPAKPPLLLYHGTATRFLDSIRKAGLLKQQRHHVHLSESQETASSVGERYGKLVLLKIEAGQMYEDGHVFCRSANRVWLTEHVPVRYIVFPPQ